MKLFFKELYNSRLGKYILYFLIYSLLWKLTNFELTIITIGGTIIGELDYQFRNHNS